MVSFMKKVIMIFIVFLSMYFIYNIFNKEEVLTVSLKEETFFHLDDYNVFYLNLEEEEITTLNLDKILTNDIDIISITGYINPIYTDKIGNIKYKFENISYKKNINRFTKYYIDTIKQKGINDNFSDVSITGIKIKELEVYAKGSDIVNMIYLKPKIKYKNFLNENYNYLNF